MDFQIFNATGGRTPLVVAPTLAGPSHLGARFAVELGNDWPVINLHRIKTGETYNADLDEMVQSYIDQFKSAGFDGSFNILGFSFGAQVAYALAVRLRSLGHRVENVILLDDDADVHRRAFGIESHRPPLNDAIVAARYTLHRNTLKRYGGRIFLMQADHWAGDRRPGPASDWEYLAEGGVEVCNFRCSHSALVMPNVLSQWIGTLKQILEDTPTDPDASAPLQPNATYYPSAVASVPDCALRAYALAKQGDLAGEIATYESEIERLPEWALINLASAYSQDNRPERAIAALEQAARGVSNISNCHWELARLYKARGNKAALETLSATIRALPVRGASDYQMLGNILTLSDFPDQAVSAYESALELDPLRTECYSRCARVLRSQSNHHKAFTLLEAAIKANPEILFLREALAELHIALGEDDKAEVVLNEIERAEPSRPKATLDLASLHLRRGAPAKALPLVLTALKKHRGHVMMHTLAGDIALALGDVEQAEALYRDTIALFAAHMPAWMGLIRTLQNAGRHAEALSVALRTPVSMRNNYALKHLAGELLFALDTQQLLTLLPAEATAN